jgi:hypothetical protein
MIGILIKPGKLYKTQKEVYFIDEEKNKRGKYTVGSILLCVSFDHKGCSFLDSDGEILEVDFNKLNSIKEIEE